MNHTITHTTKITVTGEEIQARIDKFTEEWLLNPTDLKKLVEGVYLDGVERGLRLAGINVTSKEVLPTNEVDETVRDSERAPNLPFQNNLR